MSARQLLPQQQQQQGQQNVAGQVEVMELTASSQLQKQQHEQVLMDLEAKKVAATVDVPTLPDQVRSSLRQLGLPVRLFAENLANVRDRLRMELARRQVVGSTGQQQAGAMKREQQEKDDEEEEITKYTRASQALVDARLAMASFSLERAAKRLETERRLRTLAAGAVQKKRTILQLKEDQQEEETKKIPAENELSLMDKKCLKAYRALRQATLEGSQYADSRALSCICAVQLGGIPVVATGSWTGTMHLWDGSSPMLEPLGQHTMCHEDRIMGIAMQQVYTDYDDAALIATTSIDMTGKLWRVQKSDVVMTDEESNMPAAPTKTFTIVEQATLQGHEARLCRAAFHPMKRHVATTSFDHTWRLWDIETGQNLLLQDGHWKECYGIGFHPDGSLCATTDFGGVVQVWDLRTGKSIKHFLGHAMRVLNAEFHPNGFQLATGGDDGTIKVWDLRRRKQVVSLPGHSALVTQLQFDSDGEYLASSSFDGKVKLWGCRDWKMLNQMLGHEGKVTGVAVLPNRSFATCGHDKTLKLWR
jgi:U4/U6 small nuclear ribonucleoprotein PRP4